MRAGSARVIGLTGSPGVGKSTSTSALVAAYRPRCAGTVLLHHRQAAEAGFAAHRRPRLPGLPSRGAAQLRAGAPP